MIKTLFASMLLLLLSGCIAPAYAEEVIDNPFTFHQPAPKVSDAYFKQAQEMVKKGNKNVKMFMEKMQAGWDETQKAQGRDEPSDIFLGCVLYQIHGPKSLDDIDLVHTALVLSGGPREDGKGNYTAEDAHALVDSWNDKQYEVGYKLWHALNYYAGACYQYVHGGFIVKPAALEEYTHNYALDK